MISFKNVTYIIKNKTILNNITFNIKRKEKVLLIGKSGSGKSTIFNLLIKNIYPTSGNIFFDKRNILQFSNKQTQLYKRKDISIIYQKDDLFDDMTVKENLCLFYEEQYVNKMIKRASLTHLLDKKVSTLSGGERQRINIIKATLSSFEVLLCDEITSALDDKNATKIIEFILSLFPDKTIIFISHNEELFTNKIDKIIKIEDHKISYIKTINDVYYKKKNNKDENYGKSLLCVSIINGLKKISFSSFINYIILLLCIIITFFFDKIAMHYASLSYKSYFDYDVVFVKDYKDEIINENLYYDLSTLFISSDIYINDIKTNNTMFLPFNNKNNYTPIVVNSLYLKRYNVSNIKSLKIIGEINYSNDDIDIIEEENMFTTAYFYYDIKYFSSSNKEYKSSDIVLLDYDFTKYDTRFTNNPLYNEKKEDKPYLDSNAYKDYLTYKLIFDSISDIINFFFIMILIFSCFATSLIYISYMLKDVKNIAIYLSRGYEDYEIIISYIIPSILYFLFSLALLFIIPLYILLFPIIIQLTIILISYKFIKGKNIHNSLKEDVLC